MPQAEKRKAPLKKNLLSAKKTAAHRSAPDVGRKYVYCIIPSNEDSRFGVTGLQGAGVYTVPYKDIAAVVSDAPDEGPAATRDNRAAHERLNETLTRKHTVIPMPFGTLFNSREDIVELLRSAHASLSDVLTKMEDKLELGLKVLWDREVMVHEIEDQDEDVRRLKQEIQSQKGSTYFARTQYGRLVDAALQAHSEKYLADIFDSLRDVALASRSNKPDGESMIMNAAFLVARDKQPLFAARVKDIAARFDKLTFKHAGPSNNFVNIRLKLERAQEK